MHDQRQPTRTLLLTGLLLGAGLALPACGGEDEPQDDPYVFAEDAPDAYTRVDRIGMPAIGTAVIMDKQTYNEADPERDAGGEFVDQITASLDGLHMALDDDITGAGLTPCATMDCVGQAAPLVVPDTLKLDVSGASGFPNGRRLEDPVIDVTLAVVLLDLAVDGQEVTSLVGVLNPTANDRPFESAFPYLAPAHQP